MYDTTEKEERLEGERIVVDEIGSDVACVFSRVSEAGVRV